MSRIPAIESRDQLHDDDRAVYDAIVASRGHASGPWAVLLNSPILAGRVADLGAYLRFEGTLDDQTREVVILATARTTNCRYEWADHVPMAKKAGVPEAVIHGIRHHATDALPGNYSQLTQYVRHLVEDHAVSEAEVKGIVDRFGAQGALELTATVGYYTMLATTLNAFAVEPIEGSEALPD